MRTSNAEVEPMKIISAEVGPMPRPMPEGMFDAMPQVRVTYDDGSHEALFTFFPDEISFSPGEFTGLTREEAMRLRHGKDVDYLKS